jgi:hypothetical protein
MASSTRSTAAGVPEMVKLVVWSNSGVRCSASTVRKRMPLISPESEPTDQYAHRMRDLLLVLQPSIERVQPAVAVAGGCGLVPTEQGDDEGLDVLASGVGQAASAVGPSVCSEVRGELINRLKVRLDGAW